MSIVLVRDKVCIIESIESRSEGFDNGISSYYCEHVWVPQIDYVVIVIIGIL